MVYMADAANNSFNFDTGLKTFEINNNPDCTITFNPADAAFFDRLCQAAKNIATATEASEEHDLENYPKMEAKYRTEINNIFGEDICKRVFGLTSVAALGSNGYPVAYNFLMAIKNQCEADIKERTEKLKKNTAKYTDGYENENLQSASNT